MRELKRDLWPHKVTINLKPGLTLDEVDSWLTSRFGGFKKGWNYNIVDYYGGVDFYFKQEQDATLFALRWS
jgi:hypothetical protein